MTYKSYSFKEKNESVYIDYFFELDKEIFKTNIILKNTKSFKDLDNLIFHLGLIEMLNYWKLKPTNEIVIECGKLNKEQIKFLKKVILNGMGEYFYINKLDFPNLKISSKGKSLDVINPKLRNRALVPIGGGKDAPVTIDILKKNKLGTFILNPKKPQLDIAKIARVKDTIIVNRALDKKIFNDKYLNGHVPFSAFLAFLSLIVARTHNYNTIAFSWEKSSNEGNVKYKKRIINHQWSKSQEFEDLFKKYSRKYLIKSIKFKNPLRKYTETEIIKKFAKLKQYHPYFVSCNQVYKIKAKNTKWCGKCPKCLFVYSSLFPYLDKKELNKIFKKDLLDDKSLIPVAKQLIGDKPFECVGTIKETKEIFKKCLEKDNSIILKNI